MKEVFLSIVIPSYNEMVNLQKGVLEKVDHFLRRRKFTYEVIIVDDGSTDGSVQFVQEFAKENEHFRLLENHHTGKAGAVTAGVLSAKGEYVLFTDMDQATPIGEIDNILPFFDEGFDVVIGSRSNKREGAPLTRVFISRAQIILRKLIVGLVDITDTQCGFKAFKKEVAQTIFTKIKKLHNFEAISGSAVTAGFDVELLLIARKNSYTIKEVPVKWLYAETRRVSPIKDSIQGVIDLLRIRMNELKGLYD